MTALTRLRQGLGLEKVEVFKYCREGNPMPTDADRRQWLHPDAQILTMTQPFPPAKPMAIVACPHCGDFWTESR